MRISYYVGLIVACAGVTAAAADPAERLQEYIQGTDPHKMTPYEASQASPHSPNPWLSLPPAGARTDWGYWNARKAEKSRIAKGKQSVAQARLQSKPGKGVTTESIRGLGSRPTDINAVDISGETNLPPADALTPNAEDEGSIPLATLTNLSAGNAVRASATIGDGPFGSAESGSGDVDFYRIENVVAGQEILVDIDTANPFGALDPFVALYDANGVLIAFNDDEGSTFDSLLAVEAPADGDYFVSVTGFGTFALDDPFDSSSAPGAASEGDYDILVGLDYFDERFFTFRLRKRDIFGAALDGIPGNLSLTDKSSLERQGSSQDVTFLHPDASPLPGGGTAALSHAVDRAGRFSLRLRSRASGAFNVSLRVFRPVLRNGNPRNPQTIFLDFDGETIDAGALFLGAPGTLVDLSPLEDFLPNWGLEAADKDAVINAIVASVRESLVRDIRRRGREPAFKIRLRNSRDHEDRFGRANVSRIIVGGTIPELTIPIIGIAESIDVGNFETEETAVVLLDLLSAPPDDPNSLNSFPRGPDVSIIDIIGIGVGNIIAHEAGHYLGNWHTDQFDPFPNIQDQGGNLPNTVGVGPDGIFGTDDDFDVDFGLDVFIPSEGFTGVEDTLNTIAIGTPRPRRR